MRSWSSWVLKLNEILKIQWLYEYELAYGIFLAGRVL